ncbi:MAG: undecaprenyl-diphosphate phosphatase [Heliobacteriaceae bacterium]|nr:undecaprenyl-diphosphate phosphatase [Heliobacteriaceae bacterium]
MNQYLIATVLGIVEGLTEYIPVSSTGHLILTGALLGFTDQKAATFEVFIQLGAILAVLLLYRERFHQMLQLFRRNGLSVKTGGLSVVHIGAAMAPALAMGYLCHKAIKTYLFSEETVLIGLVAGGIFMLLATRYQARRPVDSLDEISVKQAFSVGLFQCLSLWPGFSRSGATIAGGMLSGLKANVAAELSFIVAVPVMFAATGYDLLKSYQFLAAGDLPFFAVGFLVSFFVAWLAIVWFLRLLNKLGLAPFAWYRFALAALYWLFIL